MTSSGERMVRAAASLGIGCMLVIGGCAPTAPSGGADAPQIPPLSSFVMSFADFTGGGADKPDQSAAILVGDGSISEARQRAVVQLAAWQSLVTVTLAVPVAALAESFTHEPEVQPDGAWVWAYDFRVLGQAYSARLRAEFAGANILWDMYISKEGAYSDVNWFSGRSGLLSQNGEWTVNRDPNDPTPFIKVSYEGASGDGVDQIRYDSIEEGADLFGSHITHAFVDGGPYDRAYDIYTAANDNLVEIEWDHLSKAGRTRDPLFYGDDDWRCWDESLEDVDCGE